MPLLGTVAVLAVGGAVARQDSTVARVVTGTVVDIVDRVGCIGVVVGCTGVVVGCIAAVVGCIGIVVGCSADPVGCTVAAGDTGLHRRPQRRFASVARVVAGNRLTRQGPGVVPRGGFAPVGTARDFADVVAAGLPHPPLLVSSRQLNTIVSAVGR